MLLCLQRACAGERPDALKRGSFWSTSIRPMRNPTEGRIFGWLRVFIDKQIHFFFFCISEMQFLIFLHLDRSKKISTIESFYNGVCVSGVKARQVVHGSVKFEKIQDVLCLIFLANQLSACFIMKVGF